MSILVTGATGFLGGYLVARLLETTDEQIVCIVRGQHPQERLVESLAPLGEFDLTRVSAVYGDLSEPGSLNVDVSDVTAIIHSAADVRFDRPLEGARAINVEGARKLVALARKAPKLERFVHVSTAYVAGTHEGIFDEDDLDVGQRFRNTYEQTKFEAERIVRSSGLPVRVVRPSIVVGEAATGWTSSFNVLYPPQRSLTRGLEDTIPGDPESILDVVPVDHVADVILLAVTDPDDDHVTFHAVAGDGALTTTELVGCVASHAGMRDVPDFDPTGADLPPGGLEIYAPYLTVRTHFGASGVRAKGLEPALFRDYLPRLLAFADDARWGKKVVPRPFAPALG
jgi:long-chain acyl-CoA synthetase